MRLRMNYYCRLDERGVIRTRYAAVDVLKLGRERALIMFAAGEHFNIYFSAAGATAFGTDHRSQERARRR